MSFLLQPFQIVLAVLIELIRKEQEKVIEYLQLESRILREQIGGKRVLLNDAQRRLLAVKGKTLGRQQLGKIATVAQADTILRWHRELIEPNGGFKASLNTVGRPPVEQEIVELVLRMARENESWGYKRIEGELRNAGYAICSSTVANILKRHGVEPAPDRKRTTSWSTFFKAHWDVFEGLDLASMMLWIKALARGFFGWGAKNKHARCATAARGNDPTMSEEAPRSVPFAICVPPAHPLEADPARPPPIWSETTSFREMQRAA